MIKLNPLQNESPTYVENDFTLAFKDILIHEFSVDPVLIKYVKLNASSHAIQVRFDISFFSFERISTKLELVGIRCYRTEDDIEPTFVFDAENAQKFMQYRELYIAHSEVKKPFCRAFNVDEHEIEKVEENNESRKTTIVFASSFTRFSWKGIARKLRDLDIHSKRDNSSMKMSVIFQQEDVQKISNRSYSEILAAVTELKKPFCSVLGVNEEDIIKIRKPSQSNVTQISLSHHFLFDHSRKPLAENLRRFGIQFEFEPDVLSTKINFNDEAVESIQKVALK